MGGSANSLGGGVNNRRHIGSAKGGGMMGMYGSGGGGMGGNDQFMHFFGMQRPALGGPGAPLGGTMGGAGQNSPVGIGGSPFGRGDLGAPAGTNPNDGFSADPGAGTPGMKGPHGTNFHGGLGNKGPSMGGGSFGGQFGGYNPIYSNGPYNPFGGGWR